MNKIIVKTKNREYTYSVLEWNLSWAIMFILGFITCKIISLL